jgi:hypothetical protein
VRDEQQSLRTAQSGAARRRGAPSGALIAILAMAGYVLLLLGFAFLIQRMAA